MESQRSCTAMHIPEQLKPRHRRSEGLDYPSCIPAASLAVCVAVRAVFLPWIPDSSDDGSQGSEAGLRFIIKPKIRSLACRPSPIRSQIPLLSTVMLAFSIPWLPMHDASSLSFLPVSWQCMLRGTQTFLSALLASSDPVPFTLLVAGDCFAFWVPSSK